MAEADLRIEQRTVQLLQHLGITQVHAASCNPPDWKGLVTTYPERIASLTLVCPQGVDQQALQSHASRLLAITGDQGALAERVRQPLTHLTGATIHTLRNYGYVCIKVRKPS